MTARGYWCFSAWDGCFPDMGTSFGSACKCFSAMHKLVSGLGPIGRLPGLPLHYVAEQKLRIDIRYKILDTRY